MRNIGWVALAAALMALVMPGAITPAHALGLGAWGLEAGASWSDQKLEYDGAQLLDPNELLLGFTGGAFVTATVGPAWLSPRVEVLYAQRGLRDENPRFDESGQPVGISTTEAKGHYLSVPVLLGLVKHLPGASPFFAAGLGLEVLLDWQDDDLGIFEEMDRTSLGLHLATGLELEKVGFVARYFQDLTNPWPGVEGGTLESVKNRSFTLMLTIKLGPS